MNILITGGSGILGSELSRLYPLASTPTHKEMDITDKGKVLEYIEKSRPDLIIHLAAATSVSMCKENKKLAWDTTIEGTRHLVSACKMYLKDPKFVLMSTPCIFNGDEDREHEEEDIPDPDSYYGFTKSLQECIVKESGLDYLIIRSNFVARKKWPFEKAFVDRYSYYLFADTLAEQIKQAISQDKSGVIHIKGDKLFSMFDIAKITTPEVKPLTLQEYYDANPHAAKLTKNMKLKSTRWQEVKVEH